MEKKVPTPELDKMLAHKEASQTIGEFLDWARERGYEFCAYDDTEDAYQEIGMTIERILALYFDIDLNKCERERTALLESIRTND